MPIKPSKETSAVRMLKYGMVGGGPGAFIGDVHRRAIALDGKIKIVAGSFSDLDWETLETGKNLGLDKNRVYLTYQEMAEKEAVREDGIDFVTIVTPNFLHYDIAKTFLKKGIYRTCDG
jgi:predicted dehydrogenase